MPVDGDFIDDSGSKLLSKSAVSDITEVLWQQYEAFATRDLSGYEIAYLFMDGVAERLNPGDRREAVLCAWGIDIEGTRHLLHLAPGTKEDTASYKTFIQDMKRRGLCDPLTSDRWSAGIDPGRGGMLPALCPPAVPGA